MIHVMTSTPVPLPAERPPPGPGDRDLEFRAALGERVALEALLREHGPAVAQLCLHLTGPTDGPDAAQEAFEKVVTNIGRFDPTRGGFRTWACAVARNQCRDRLRRRGLERQTFAGDGESHSRSVAGVLPDPERTATARGEAERLRLAMADLPDGMREAIVLFHVQGATYEEIAAGLDVPIGTVMTWLHRGRKRLRAALEGG